MGLSLVTLVSWKCSCWFPGQSCCPTRWFLALYPLPFPKSNIPSISNGDVTSCLSISFSFFRRIGPIKSHTLWALPPLLLRHSLWIIRLSLYLVIITLTNYNIYTDLVIKRTLPKRQCTASMRCHSTLSYRFVSEPARKFIIGSTVSSTFGPDIGWGCGPTVGFSLSFSALPLIGKRSNSTATIPFQFIKKCWASKFIKIHCGW